MQQRPLGSPGPCGHAAGPQLGKIMGLETCAAMTHLHVDRERSGANERIALIIIAA
jgi:hypothetical protein